MVESSPLANAIQFFKNFGLFDVVLPFLLVFAIVFAILEKTRILGTEGKKEDQIPKKNLNSMVSFVIALFVVASNQIVNAITTALPNIVLLVIVAVSFLMLVGVFATTNEFSLKGEHENYYKIFIAIMFIGVILIFLGAIETSSGQSWLGYGYDYVLNYWGGSIVSSLILLAVIVGAIIYIVGGKGGNEDK